MHELYECIIPPKRSLDKRQFGPHSYFARLQVSIEVIGFLFPDRRPADIPVLDFGMGWGHWVVMAQAHGFDVYGTELSEIRKSYAKKLGVRVIDDLFTSELEGRFSFINAHQVMEHVPDPGAMLSKLARLLAPKGIIKIFVPNGTGYRRKIVTSSWRAAKDAAQPLEHINTFNVRSITALAASAGLRRLALTDFPTMTARLRMLRKWAKAKVTPSWYFRNP